jgi:redox-sensitive bicupin YhaK (pirin superfamily)
MRSPCSARRAADIAAALVAGAAGGDQTSARKRLRSAQERALYVVAGEIDIAGGRLRVFRLGDPMMVTAASAARVILVSGAAMEEPRYIWWN